MFGQSLKALTSLMSVGVIRNLNRNTLVTGDACAKRPSFLPLPIHVYKFDVFSVSGGSDPAKSTKTSVPTSDAFVYGLDTDEWKQISSMLTPRMHHAVCSLFGMVYAIGGQDENARQVTQEALTLNIFKKNDTDQSYTEFCKKLAKQMQRIILKIWWNLITNILVYL